MPLLYDPSVTFNTQGNILAISTSLPANGTNSASVVDYSSNLLGGWVQIYPTGGSAVAATNGCQVSIYPAGDATPHYDYYALIQFTIAMVVSTATPQSVFLPTGKYNIILKNLDATNAITVGITSNPVS